VGGRIRERERERERKRKRERERVVSDILFAHNYCCHCIDAGSYILVGRETKPTGSVVVDLLIH
jgi:hypothetical protein